MIRPCSLLHRTLLIPGLLLLGLAGAAEKPNILFVLTDDQGWTSLGCYGNEHVATPHLDRLAADGIRFTDAYVTSQCTPTRASLLTGQHTARNGMWHVIPWYGSPWAPMTEPPFVESLPRESFTLAKGLREAGYATTCIGKWHLTDQRSGNYVALDPEAAPAFGFDEAPAPPGWSYHKEGDKGVEWLTEQALDFIDRKRGQPWFVYLSHHTIHGPVVAPEELVAKHREAGAPEVGPFNASYLAAIETLDRGMGRLLDGLEELGEAEQTIVVFLSDNGGVDFQYDPEPFLTGPGKIEQLAIREHQFPNDPLRSGKGSPYEGGIRVPCLVRWPGVVEAGRVEPTPVHVTDWLPTLLGAAGTGTPEDWPVDGLDLGPLLRDETFPERSLYFHFPLYDLRWGLAPCAVVRRGKWKLIEWFGDRFDESGRYVPGHHLELFDLESDRGETQNLAPVEKATAARLRGELRSWLSSLEAPVPVPNPHYDPERPFQETKEKPEWYPESGRR